MLSKGDWVFIASDLFKTAVYKVKVLIQNYYREPGEGITIHGSKTVIFT